MPFCDYMIFADESGDHGLDQVTPEYPVFVLAFALVSKAEYVSSVVPALQGLKLRFFGHDQIVFHERDIRKQLPPFGRLRTDAAMRGDFLGALNEVIAQIDVQFIVAVINKQILKEKYANPYSPYEIGLLFCLEQLHARLLSLGEEGKSVHVVFESRGGPEDQALELEFRRVVSNARRWGWRAPDFQRFTWEPMIVPKSVNSSGLQLADLAARPIGLHVLRPNQPNRAFDVLRPKLWAIKRFP